ncbi:39S ribosomal protein L9, mitochondrial [Lonchura striata]|uniref:Large ribosomal subunit protein bL9m n=1 Tax=Lonchura striata TaxID=40157 RepID=A0A218UBP6_9PASE|nr:39S ribosomal protein L9, mitochondrial [Lonchura striata domestica]OWK50910.1 39S ribosomal protein L9, mitochondrial [Lonchura striata domestica]
MLAPGAAGRALSRALGLGHGPVGPGAPARALSLSHGPGSVVVERVYPVPLARAGAVPRPQPRRFRVFRLLRDGKHRPRGELELLLSRAVQGLGGRGDVVSVGKSRGRNQLLAQGLAQYPSPENLRRFQRERELAQQGKLEEPQTLSGQKTLEFLRRCRLQVGMKNNRSWELSPAIVARHFLKNLGVSVPPHALRLPPEPITRWGHSWCDVTVNGLDTVRVPMDVVQFLHPKTKRFRHWRQRQQQQLESSRERLL